MNYINNQLKTITLCQSGGKKINQRIINEDIVGTDDGYAFLMDGATGLGGPESINGLSVAEWYVQFVADFLKTELPNKDKDIKLIVTEAIQYATIKIKKYEDDNNIKFEAFSEPSSSLIIYRRFERNGTKYFQVFELGDSCAAIKYRDGKINKLYNPNEFALKALDNSVLNRMLEISKQEKINVIDTRNNPEIQKMLEINRAKKNIEGGYWALGTNIDAVNHAALYEEPVTDVEKVLLYSDGFNYDILDLTIEDILNNYKNENDFKILQEKIREAEELDKNANKQARFKMHDDMSLILIEH